MSLNGVGGLLFHKLGVERECAAIHPSNGRIMGATRCGPYKPFFALFFQGFADQIRSALKEAHRGINARQQVG